MNNKIETDNITAKLDKIYGCLDAVGCLTGLLDWGIM